MDAVDITSFALLDSESVGLPETHSRALDLFTEHVILPSLEAIDAQIEELGRSEDPSSVFLEDDLASLFASALEGFLLSVQAMWERGLRRLLLERDRCLRSGSFAADLKKAAWSSKSGSLQQHFEQLFGLPIQSFYSFKDLDLLQSLGNAIRHGDGPSAEKVHQLAPGLWWNWHPPGTDLQIGTLRFTVPHDAPKHPSFDQVTLRQAVLEQMIRSVSQFWMDLELLRCSSFRVRHESVQRRLDVWRDEILGRPASRIWTPD